VKQARRALPIARYDDGMAHELDSTLQSFPSYAELTQTQAWGKQPRPIRADTDDAEQAVEVSHGSRYTEGPILGVGGMGKVLLVQDARVGREVALKVLHAERELEPQERARFLREAQVQGQLEHPSIVPVYDIDRRPDGTTFFTMRRVLGRTLAAILDDLRKGVPAAKARYTQRELLTAFATVCLTIDYAHSRGVVHRDLKPANIMLGDFGEVYVLDWGLARLVNEQGDSADEPQARLSMPGRWLGTPMYMAPEQMMDPDVGPAADVFSLGTILFEILTLERARDPNALYAPIEGRPSVRAPYRNVAPELEMICVGAMEMEPKSRFASPRLMQEGINRYLEGDRAIEARRELATKHVQAARVALGKSVEPNADHEKERGVAITELGRAVALDPQNAEYFEMLGELLATPPVRIPREVVEQTEQENQRLLHVGAKHSATATASWWLFFPLLVWIGINSVWQLSIIAVPVMVALGLSIFMARQRIIRQPIQYASISFLMIAAMATSRFYGPFVLVPQLITTYAIVLQAHPSRHMRVASACIAAIAMVLPPVLEWIGVLPASYVFEAGTWRVVPQLVELPRLGTYAFLTIANVGMIVIPCLFIAKIREELTRAQLRLATQAWQFKQLGARLIGRPEGARP
jgi:eukaryotic-like serine/threonine-protein kinase